MPLINAAVRRELVTDRRAFIGAAAALLTAPLAAGAQPAAKVPRVGILGSAPYGERL